MKRIRKITVTLSSFDPSFGMTVKIPEGRDDEEYIDELLEGILNDFFRFHYEWDFTD